MKARTQQTGFTLIELVVVIVILGILAATALPKFVDLSADAERAAVKGVAGGLSSAASINYGARKIAATNGVAVASCLAVSNAMQTFPTDYTISPTTAIAADATVTNCVVTKGAYTANFTAIGA